MDDGRATSKSEIDRLGERLKAGDVTTDDLRLLADYGARFVRPYVEVLHDLGSLGLNPSGRAPKSRDSIVAKLRRESIRMTQIQDVAGCRVVVPGPRNQEAAVRLIQDAMAPARALDRQRSSSQGYRAVHFVVARQELFVEVQVRTAWQHHWAAVSEKLADELGQDLKYGGGPLPVSEALLQWSASIAEWEDWLSSERAPSGITLATQTRIEHVHQRVLAGRALVLAAAAPFRRGAGTGEVDP